MSHNLDQTQGERDLFEENVEPGQSELPDTPPQQTERPIQSEATSSSPKQALGGRQVPPGVHRQQRGGRALFSPRQSVDDGASTIGSTVGKYEEYFDQTISNATPEKLHKLIYAVHKTIPIQEFVDNISYQGFNRYEFIKMAMDKITPSQFLRFAIMGAIRGSNFSKIETSCIKVDSDLVTLVKNQVVTKSGKRKSDITILRCTASVPQWSAFYLLSSGVPPKLTTTTLDPCFQFPAAASLPMSASVRQLHVDFCVQFSRVINGKFNGNIYMAAFNNQLPLKEIPPELLLKLGASSAEESRMVPVSGFITEAEGKLVRAS